MVLLRYSKVCIHEVEKGACRRAAYRVDCVIRRRDRSTSKDHPRDLTYKRLHMLFIEDGDDFSIVPLNGDVEGHYTG